MYSGLNIKILVRQATKYGYIAMCNGGVCDLSYLTSDVRRGRVQGGGIAKSRFLKSIFTN